MISSVWFHVEEILILLLIAAVSKLINIHLFLKNRYGFLTFNILAAAWFSSC